MENIKQVIVVRKDLNMRRGKSEAQVAHASMKVFFDRLKYLPESGITSCDFTQEMRIWMNNSFTKIVVSCNSEEELLDLQKQAEEAGIVNAIIQDNGFTEFNGVRTYTCLAIGPDYSDKIDKITGHLQLR